MPMVENQKDVDGLKQEKLTSQKSHSLSMNPAISYLYVLKMLFEPN